MSGVLQQRSIVLTFSGALRAEMNTAAPCMKQTWHKLGLYVISL